MNYETRQEAAHAAKETLDLITDFRRSDFKIQVWNTGTGYWTYSVSLGGLTLYKVVDLFNCMLTSDVKRFGMGCGELYWQVRASCKDPNQAIKLQLTYAKKHIELCQSIVAEVEKSDLLPWEKQV